MEYAIDLLRRGGREGREKDSLFVVIWETNIVCFFHFLFSDVFLEPN